MRETVLSLLAFTGWTLTLVVVLITFRSVLTLSGRRAANAFAPSGDDVSPFSGRLVRAHVNCLENLPIFAALVVVAALLERFDVTAPLAPVVVVLRVLQSSVHLVSTNVPAVLLRFTFFVGQIAIFVWWGASFARAALG